MLARLGTAFGLLALCAISVISRRSSTRARTGDFARHGILRRARDASRRADRGASTSDGLGRSRSRARLYRRAARADRDHAAGAATTAIGTRYQEAGRVQNLLAWLPGADPKGKAVLLVAHYDGVGAGPAASDDGAGTAALLETMRALRARKEPLAHDVILLFTDGEEAGLLGAAAFVREHPWAKDVAVILNFEARGTSGRSYMFETGPGNRDAVSALRRRTTSPPDRCSRRCIARCRMTPICRSSRCSGYPRSTSHLRTAWSGTTRATTTSRISIRAACSITAHRCSSLAKAFASETLPRPKTGDAVFFDLPIIGLVVYPDAMRGAPRDRRAGADGRRGDS